MDVLRNMEEGSSEATEQCQNTASTRTEPQL
jgi:hypothetical protein